MANQLENQLSEIIEYLKIYSAKNPQHIQSCDFLLRRFRQIQEELKPNEFLSSESIEWCTWFAPRIIYEGINDQGLLNKLEELIVSLKIK